MQANYFIPQEKIQGFMKNPGMKNQYGIEFIALADPEAAARALPPPLKLTNPKAPAYYGYIVNIRNPTFASWYMEGGVGLMAQYGDVQGLYFLGLMLSGPGALMGAFSGRESSGLPKKLCERIVVERQDDWGHCFIQRDGVRLLDVTLRLGSYNDPSSYSPSQEGCTYDNPATLRGGCLLHKYQLGDDYFSGMELVDYVADTKYYSWEPAAAEVKLASSRDDPWAEVSVTHVLGAGWMVSDNIPKPPLKVLYEYSLSEGQRAMQNLFAGRYDQCTLYSEHQHYE